MREIDSARITEVVKRLCIEGNRVLPADIRRAIETMRSEEPWGVAEGVLDNIIENYNLAETNQVAICQDTGMVCVFVEVGQEVHINGNLHDAINEGVRQGYEEGFLRKSVVGDPLNRVNTKDNSPAMIYTEIVEGDQIEITVAPKGFGSENMSQLKMLRPSDGVEGVVDFVLQVVKEAGPNPCPPIVVGVGIGGTFDKAANIAKKALMRSVEEHNPDSYYAALEQRLLEEINALGIGPQGFGGRTTALAVAIEALPTHIAGLPVAVNINCHVTRHMTEVI